MIHHNGTKTQRKIDHFFETKPNLIGDPELGAKLCPMTLANSVTGLGDESE
jgi:hypothetical protein